MHFMFDRSNQKLNYIRKSHTDYTQHCMKDRSAKKKGFNSTYGSKGIIVTPGTWNSMSFLTPCYELPPLEPEFLWR